MVTGLGCCKRSKEDSGNGKSILGPVKGSPVGAEVDRTRRSPVKGRKVRGYVVFYNTDIDSKKD